MQLTRQQKILATCIGFLITFFASTIKGSYQVYFLELVSISNMLRADFALTGAIFGLSIGIMSPLVGYICDRYGAVVTILSGALSASLSFYLLSLPFSYWVFMFSFGILAAYALTAMTFIPLGLLIQKIFQNSHQGLAYAAITNGTAVGFMVLSPVFVWLNSSMPWYDLTSYLSIIYLLVISPLIFGLYILLSKEEKNSINNRVDSIAKDRFLPLLLEKPFLLLALSFSACGSSMAFIDVHLVPLLQERLTNTQGGNSVVALSLSVLGAAELFGAFIIGWLIGFGREFILLAILYAFRVCAMLILLIDGSSSVYVIYSIIFGLSYMGTVIITSMMCLRWYGEEIKGKMFGFLFTAHQISVFITVWLGGFIYDETGSYRLLIVIVSGLSFMAVIASLVLANLEKMSKKSIISFES